MNSYNNNNNNNDNNNTGCLKELVQVEMRCFNQSMFSTCHNFLHDLQGYTLALKYRLLRQICFCQS